METEVYVICEKAEKDKNKNRMAKRFFRIKFIFSQPFVRNKQSRSTSFKDTNLSPL